MWISFETQKPENNQVVMVKFKNSPETKITIQYFQNELRHPELIDKSFGKFHHESEFSHWMDLGKLK
jgi:hypothetical protein